MLRWIVKIMSYFIQSLPHKGKFYHHANYSALKMIAIQGQLKEGKPYSGISMTTDVGRFLNPLPILGLACVDGYIEFSAESVEEYAFPVLYRSYDAAIADEAATQGYKVYEKIEKSVYDERPNPQFPPIPPQYQYIMPYCVKNSMFIRENEWKVILPILGLTDYKVYILPKLYKRMKNSLPPYCQNVLFPMEKRSEKDRARC
jgi:hypothetical protein